MLIKKCTTKGHQEKLIEYISIQDKEILWACQYCVKENEKKYQFFKITEIKQVIEKTKKDIPEDLSEKIKEEFNNFTKKFETMKNELNFYIRHLEMEASLQFKEVLNIIDFVNSFNEIFLDSPNPIGLKNLQRILSNEISFSQSYQINSTQRYEEILKISAIFSQHIKSIQQRILDQKVVQIVQQYHLPKQFQKQLEQHQTQDEHDNFEFAENQEKDAGIKYCGYVLQGLMYGYGVMLNEKEKTVYLGNFIDDMFICGSKVKLDKKEIFTGDQFESQGNYSYLCHKGLWQNEKLEKYKYTQNRYEGCFKNEVFEGNNGDIVYSNGDKYSGAFKNGQYHGYGSLKSEEFGILKGLFVNNKLNGEGYLVNKEIEYEGEFKDNFMDGKGQLTNFQDKSIYNGQFVQGKKCGKGKLILSEDHEIEGYFENDQPHGECKETKKSIQLRDMKQRFQETQLTGTFEQGKKQGEFEVQIVLFNEVIEKKMVYYDEDVAIYEEQL